MRETPCNRTGDGKKSGQELAREMWWSTRVNGTTRSPLQVPYQAMSRMHLATGVDSCWAVSQNLGSRGRKPVGVRLPPLAPIRSLTSGTLAYESFPTRGVLVPTLVLSRSGH